MPLSQADADFLRSIDTPTVCNVVEMVAPELRGHGYTTRHLHCPFPDLPPMLAYAKTVTIRAKDAFGLGDAGYMNKRMDYLDYIAAAPQPSVNAGAHHFKLDKPFFVLATQNPIEQEGTYPLPEAQLDRFMFLIHVNYPTAPEELRIARETTGGAPVQLSPVLTGEEIMAYQDVVRRVPVPDHVYEYIVRMVRMARPNEAEAPEWIKKWVMWGPGPRAVQYLVLGAKANAVLRGSYLVQVEDVDAVAVPVLSHRILTNFHAESEGVTSREIIRRLVEESREE